MPVSFELRMTFNWHLLVSSSQGQNALEITMSFSDENAREWLSIAGMRSTTVAQWQSEMK